MNNLPLFVLLAPKVCDAESRVDRLAALIGAGEMLDAVGETHLAVGNDMQRDELDLEVLVVVEKLLKVAAATFLKASRPSKNDDPFRSSLFVPLR